MSGQDKDRIGVVGGGTIGASWAALFALGGHKVYAFDALPSIKDSIRDRASGMLATLVRYQVIDQDARAAALSNLVVTQTLGEAVGEAVYVQESVTEDYGVKAMVFREVEASTSPDTIIASSSSGLLIGRLQSAMEKPSRALIAHPFNPPHLVPLVELVRGEQTSQGTIDSALVLMKSLGKIPVVLNKEVAGHLANRLVAALWREAIDLVDKGVASVEDVDKALYAGPGLRWAFMGNHLAFHLGGGKGGIENFLNTLGKSVSPIWSSMSNWTEISDGAAEHLKEGVKDEVGDQTMETLVAWRDERLIRLVKALYSEE